MGTHGLTSAHPYVSDQDDLDHYFIPKDVTHELHLNGVSGFQWLQAVPQKTLTFKSMSGVADKEITFIPYYKINHQRYVVYWNLK